MSTKTTTSPFSNPHRLPTSVIPKCYWITLEPNLAEATFTGEVSIAVEVKEPVSEVVLNAADLKITRGSVYARHTSGTKMYGTLLWDNDNERVIICFNGKLGKGNWRIHANYTGKLDGKLSGFYNSTYKDAAGNENIIAATQLEPTDARRAFPCFDEPAFKARYNLTLIVDKDLSAVSNTALVKENVNAKTGKKTVVFAETIPMSTYLVAWVIGKLEATAPVNVNGTNICIYHVPGKSKLTSFALKAAAFVLAEYEKYFGVKYPGDKLDMIAIPNFAFGGMENFGCITYRETALLIDETTATNNELARVAEVIHHEIAHMWFGDYVTMEWWNGLWLNEAFATFMSNKSVDKWKPKWRIWDRFCSSDRAEALKVDGLSTTRPIEAKVNSASEALAMVDVITYRKGCSVMRMLEQYLGEETFRQGIAAYMKKHAFGNTQNSDLWDALEQASGRPVRTMMDGWIFQPGYPLITVEESEIPGAIVLAQRCFKYLAEAVDNDQLWIVPIALRVKTAEGEKEINVELDCHQKIIYLGEGIEWVIVNADSYGFYRTRYSENLAGKLLANIQNLRPIERFNFINDTWACVQAGLVSSAQYLEIAKLFGSETDPNVWSIITGSLSTIHNVLPETLRQHFEDEVRNFVRPALNQLGYEEKAGDSVQTKQLRGSLIYFLGTTGNDLDVQAKAQELYAKYRNDHLTVAADVVPAVVNIVAYTGGETEYEQFRESARSSIVPQDQLRMLLALGGFRDLALLRRTLESSLSNEVRSQDATSLLVRLLLNEKSAVETWQFIKEHFDEMVEKYPKIGFTRLFSGIVALATPELEEDVRNTLLSKNVSGGEKAIPQYLELLRIAIAFRQRESQPLESTYQALAAAKAVA